MAGKVRDPWGIMHRQSLPREALSAGKEEFSLGAILEYSLPFPPLSVVRSWQGPAHSTRVALLKKAPPLAGQGAHAGREREARSLQPTVSLDTPSEASAAERQFLERMLEQEGAGRLHALPDFQGSYAAGPSSHPSLPKERWPWTAAASGSVPWNVAAETPMGGAAAGRKGGGQAAEPQPGVTIRGVAGLAGMQEEGSSSESKVPGTRTPSGIECNDEHGSSAAAGGAAVERQLNSISLSELYLGDRFASGTYGRLYTGVFRGQVCWCRGENHPPMGARSYADGSANVLL